MFGVHNLIFYQPWVKLRVLARLLVLPRVVMPVHFVLFVVRTSAVGKGTWKIYLVFVGRFRRLWWLVSDPSLIVFLIQEVRRVY